jgi:hypothetical protein
MGSIAGIGELFRATQEERGISHKPTTELEP